MYMVWRVPSTQQGQKKKEGGGQKNEMVWFQSNWCKRGIISKGNFLANLAIISLY